MNWRQGCLLVVACLVICYTIWVLLPTSRYETESQQIVANVTQARAELQRRAKDPQQNGYLDPEFLPLWEARRVDPANAALALSSGKENEPPCQIRSLLEATSPLSDLSEGKKTELQALVSQKKTDQLRSIRELEAFYPKIQAVENRPSFVVPDDKPYTLTSPVFNLIAVRKLALACSALTDYQTLTNRGDKALETCEDSLQFVDTLADGGGPLTQLMIAVAMERLAHNSLCMVLQSDLTLNLKSLQKLRQTLEGTQLHPGLLADTIQIEYCGGLNLWEENRNSKRDRAFWEWLPGIWSRELRLYKNDYIPFIHHVQANPAGSFNFNPDSWDWLLGRHGLFSALVIPNYSGAGAEINLARKRHAFLHLYTCLRIFRLQTGHWPKTISQLTGQGYKPLETLALSQIRYSVEAEKITLELQLESDEVQRLSKTQVPEGLEKWNILSGPRWLLH